MAGPEDTFYDPLSGFPMEGPPPAPGNFSETVTNKATGNPFTPLTPAPQESERLRLNVSESFRHTAAGAAGLAAAKTVTEQPLPTDVPK